MAISLEFIDFIVPISVIHEKYPGGWKQCLIDYEYGIGGRIWYDKYLFRDGAMAPHGIEILVNEWTAKGFEPYEEIDGKRHWKDFCVAEVMFGGSTLPCNWLEINSELGCAYLKGTELGEIAGRDNLIIEDQL